MFSLQDANIHNIAIEGVFDDCQDIVKAVSNDLAFKRKHTHRHRQLDQLGAAAGAGGLLLRRLLPGHRRANDEQVSFAVPSGNFGNICAGHVARMMGLPIRRLVLATNENDVLDEFFRTGTLPRAQQRRDARDLEPVDGHLQGQSNFERFVFDLLGRDAAAHARAVRRGRAAARVHARRPTERARLPAFGFVSGRSTGADRLASGSSRSLGAGSVRHAKLENHKLRDHP